ncbi:MAG TPA: metallophosphoesterase family protein [Thermoanaerobaculaceae bacterium]|nr:metallophosphoesterase family protein [Thermoanaerobaculaceae bacterium]HPS77638.1 metallophosphoesterase family protein [Thermoanaerobaculaceae bacterium]
MSGRTFIVGDVHGCYDELQTLLAQVDLGPGDLLVAVGDLVDRGPKSWEVVRFFAAEPTRRRSVLGNHEEKHLRGDRHEGEDPSARITFFSTRPGDYDAMLAYFRTLPLVLDLPEALVVHAGLLPGVPLGEQPDKVLTGRGSQGRAGFDGKSEWWFEASSFSWPKPVVFGHQIFPEVVRGTRGQVWGLDTGAAVGGALTGLLLPDFRLWAVATPDYYRGALGRWSPVFLSRDLPRLPWRQVLGLQPAGWLEPVRREIVEAQAVWRQAIGQLGDDVSRLRAGSGYDRLAAAQRALFCRRLRLLPELESSWGRCLLRCFPGGATTWLVAKVLPDLTALRHALGERSRLDLVAVLAAVGALPRS